MCKINSCFTIFAICITIVNFIDWFISTFFNALYKAMESFLDIQVHYL